MQLFLLALGLSADVVRFFSTCFARAASIRTENAFLCKQLAMFLERGVKPRRASDREKVTLVLLARMFDSSQTPAHPSGWRASSPVVRRSAPPL